MQGLLLDVVIKELRLECAADQKRKEKEMEAIARNCGWGLVSLWSHLLLYHSSISCTEEEVDGHREKAT